MSDAAIQKTASKTALLLQCPRPFSEETETETSEAGEAAIYGTKFHNLMASKLRAPSEKWETLLVRADDDNDLVDHVLLAHEELQVWCSPSGNPFGLSFKVVEVETSRCLDLTKSSGGIRNITLRDPDGDHEYVDLAPHELAGTADVILEAETPTGIFRVVLDHKTGEHEEYYIHPAKLEQMQALAAMWEADAVAVLHTPRNVPPIVYAEAVSLDRFRHQLWSAYRLVNSGFLRTGSECKFCPARSSCPAKQGELIAAAGQVLGAALVKRQEPLTAGQFHQLRSQWNALEKQALATIREDVRAGEIIERPDGKVLELVTKNIERLSKKSILEAYGKAGGERILQKLRDDGALSEVPQEELRAK
jgi:hypothetical protein